MKYVKLLILTITLMSFGLNAYGEKIILEGSTTVLPIAQKAAEVFMKSKPKANISVRGGGSGVGIASLIDGNCDIANSSRPIRPSELDKAIARGKDIKAHVIAMDGIAVIVHPSNKIKGLTKKQIKDIYTGKISNWSQLGGDNQKIVVVSRDSASGTFEAFGELALDKEKVRPDAIMQASNQAVVSVVAKTSGAIGYVGLGYIEPSVKALEINGVMPSKETVLTEKYPIARPLFMYTNGAPQGLVKEFIDFIKSVQGQRLVDEDGFVPLK
ncbi:MAG: phosphate ABC transporter substrate-binding protein [Candidatus Omnitrophica bacterium]|nr:phosphate ABC transporter substrate-binding protein [Candidatus Omnitrophota bacterium]MCM8826645.1 phosphate ABC transporter substrate-binding protein [Candidatus Omnitrophota bacterium]